MRGGVMGKYITKQQRIVGMLRAEYERAEAAHRTAYAERVGMDAAANVWDDLNRNDGVGGIRQNPYNTLTASTREESAKLYASQMREAYEYAVDVFIEKLPTTETTT